MTILEWAYGIIGYLFVMGSCVIALFSLIYVFIHIVGICLFRLSRLYQCPNSNRDRKQLNPPKLSSYFINYYHNIDDWFKRTIARKCFPIWWQLIGKKLGYEHDRNCNNNTQSRIEYFAVMPHAPNSSTGKKDDSTKIELNPDNRTYVLISQETFVTFNELYAKKPVDN
jgi:hypothetical protein